MLNAAPPMHSSRPLDNILCRNQGRPQPTRVGQSRCCSSTVHSLVKGWELSVRDPTDSVGKAVGSLSDMRACRRLGMKMGSQRVWIVLHCALHMV